MTQLIDTSIYAAVTEAIQGEARRILSEGSVSAVVGYAAARRKGSAQPVVVTRADDAGKLIFSAACVNNLAVYLTKAKKEIPKSGKIGIVVKGCDLKALAGLMGESQLKREDLYLIGIPCAGVLTSTIRPIPRSPPTPLPPSAANATPICRSGATSCRHCSRSPPSWRSATVPRSPAWRP